MTPEELEAELKAHIADHYRRRDPQLVRPVTIEENDD